ncbi:MAG TPA: hypothetical protein VLW49_00920 [Gaiellaceae bacterium]|nr:hypothetical protein [Gaiellaceae bacterium]
MTVVEHGELRLPEALDQRENCGVDEAELQIRVREEELADSRVVVTLEIRDLDRAVDDVGEELDEWRGPESPAGEPVEFDGDRSGHDERLLRLLQQSGATPVVDVASVHGRVQRAGVDD